MQIHSLHKNIYKLYSLVEPEKSRTDFGKLCEKQVKQWELLHRHGITNKKNRSLSALVELHIIGGRSGLNARFSGLNA